MSGDLQMRNSITVQSNAPKGALYAGMVVFGGMKTPSVQLLGRDSWQPYNAGAHPWTTARGAVSTLAMFNYSSGPQPFFVMIGAGGVLWQQTYELAALETKTIDIGSLVAKGAKDEAGLVLPAAATSGVAQWFTPSIGQGAGRLLVSQPGTGLARNFGCLNEVVLCGTSSMQNSQVTILAGSNGQMGPYQADMCMGQVGNCGGTYQQTNPWSANWTSSNSSVASIQTPNGATTATINGVSAGSATITAAGVPQVNYYQPLNEQWTCNVASQTGTATVKPACATPTNLQQTFVNASSDGTLNWNYTWGSSTGKQSDLSACTFGETVTYPGGSPYTWPAPMVGSTPNPTQVSISMDAPGATDTNYAPLGGYSKPYFAANFSAGQTIWWNCPCYQNGAQQTAFTNTISRSVSLANGLWQYQATKAGHTGTATLPGQ